MKRSTIASLIIYLIVVLLFASWSAKAQNPFIPKYDAVKRSERCFTVTDALNNQFGSVWWSEKVDFSHDTLFNFVIYMGDRDGNGADGLAFVMHQDPRDTITDGSQTVTIGGAGTWDLEAATGDDGGGLGYAMHISREGPNTIPGPHGPGDDPENHKIQSSVAIEFDTWNNSDVPDGNAGNDGNGVYQNTSLYYGWDHTSVVYNGDLYGGQQIIEDANGNTGRILPLKPDYAFGTDNNPDGSAFHNVEDDRCYTYQIRWIVNPDGKQSLQLWAVVYDGTTNTEGLQMIMSHTDDMINNVFGGNSIMRFGFTGSTGGAINEQTICLLGESLAPFAKDDEATTQINNSVVIDVQSNDNDPDGDLLGFPIIVEEANHGTVNLFDSLGNTYLDYVPETNYVGFDTLRYVTCDVNSTKCYAKCDTAFVFIEVGCIPFNIDLTAISPNSVCTDSAPANGSASAKADATFLRGAVWYEGFDDVSDQATEDTGPTSWTSRKEGSDCSIGNNLYAQNYVFRTKVVTGTDCELVFETGEIDISKVSDACISIDFWTSNADYESDDYIESYFILDGGGEIMFDVNGRLDGTFGVKTASTCGLNGSTLKIVVRTKSNHSSEEYYWDNVHVTAIGAGEPDFTYNWYEGTTATGPIIFQGAINNSLHSGAYTVVAIDNLTGCPSNPETITIDSAGYKVPGGFIEQLSPFTNCQLPYDGALGAGVIDGTDTVTTGYQFEWYYQEDPKIPSFIQRTGATATNLESREYTVIITNDATGCDTTITAEVTSEVVLPAVMASATSHVTSCEDPNTGVGEASVDGNTDDYDFEWYAGPVIGMGAPAYTTASVNSLTPGNHTVLAVDRATGCTSDPRTITINDLSSLPDIVVTINSQQTSCDPLNPNGSVSGLVNEGGTPTTDGFTFNWYKGQNDIIPARPGYSEDPMVDSLEAGTYRLVVIEEGTNCTASVDMLIQDLSQELSIDFELEGTGVLDDINPDGSINVIVLEDIDINPFQFELYEGIDATEEKLLESSSSPFFEGLGSGDYAVRIKNRDTKCLSEVQSINIGKGLILGGYIQTQRRDPVVGIEVELIGGMELKTTTDEMGWYQFSVFPNQEYHIAPLFDTKDDDGVTTLDIVVMHWHILGKKYLMSNLDLIAADVNGSGSLTSLDLVETRSVVLHNDGDKFRGKNSVEFINDDYTGEVDVFEYKNYLDIIPTVSHLELNFTAVKRGDASGNWKPNKNASGRENLLNEFEIQLEEVPINGNSERIALRSSEFIEMVGMQFTLEWDPEVYQFEKLSDDLIHFEANLNQVNNGWITLSWNIDHLEGVTLDKDAILAGVEFRRLRKDDPQLSITSSITPALAFNNQLETLRISSSELNSGLSQVESNVYPNPAHDFINVEGADLHEVYEYLIINTIGVRVLYGEFTGKEAISLGNITPGIYLLKVTDIWGNVSIHEIVKQ